MKVVAFNGSPRIEGNTTRLINMVLDELKTEGIETELIQLAGKRLRGCTACMGCRKHLNSKCVIDDDGINEFIQKMLEADGIILGSPTYVSNVTAEMKALMDRAIYVTRGNGTLLRRKVGAAVVSVRRCGALTTFDTINHFFLVSEMVVPGSSYWNMGIGHAPGDVEMDEEGKATMKNLGINMAWCLKALHGQG